MSHGAKQKSLYAYLCESISVIKITYIIKKLGIMRVPRGASCYESCFFVL